MITDFRARIAHVVIALFSVFLFVGAFTGCHRNQDSQEEIDTKNQFWPIVATTSGTAAAPLKFSMSLKKTVFKTEELIEIRLRVENSGEFIVALDARQSWWRECLKVCDKDYFLAWDRQDANLDRLTGFQPDGSKAILGILLCEFGLARQLEPGEAIEKVVTKTAKRPGRYLARANLRSYSEGLAEYYTNRTPDETVAVVVAGLTKFSLPPVELEFEIRELAKSHQQSVE